jgi:hypothetical protein
MGPKRRRLCAAAILVCASSTALASQPSQSPPLPASGPGTAGNQCALHVWPAADAKSSYAGWFHGGAVNGDKRGIKGYPQMHSDVLTTAAQHDLLQQIDWAKGLARPNISVVIHDQPPEPQDDRTRTQPLIAERPACYEEFILHSVFVERAALSASTVRVVVIGKSWRDPAAPPKTYSVMMDEKVSLGGQDDKLVEQSVKAGFLGSIHKALVSSSFQH